MHNCFVAGDWNAICDVCGFKFKASMLKQRWDGLKVCKDDWEMRHPQDLIHIPEDNPAVPWSRPESGDTFISVSYPLTIESFPYDYIQLEDTRVLSTEG